jgi:type III secretion system FlhB-like substrate exporter
MNNYGINAYAKIQGVNNMSLENDNIDIINKANMFGIEIFQNQSLVESLLNTNIDDTIPQDAYENLENIVDFFDYSIKSVQMS